MNEETDFSEELIEEGFSSFGDIKELEKEDILFNEDVFRYVFGIENPILRQRTIAKLELRAKELKISRQFGSLLKTYKEEQEKEYIYDGNIIRFSGLKNENYKVNRYEMNGNGEIYEVVPNVGKFLVCYHPIVPIEKYKTIEDGSEKIKIAYFVNEHWNYIIVEKSTIASTQAIIRLADVGIAVSSETAKYLVKYLMEVENLNRDIIKTNISVSRIGWFDNKLIPYDKTIEFDNEREFPRVYERFSEKGNLEDWKDFFREKRKYNDISRIVMAGAVASIILKKIDMPGFTIHIWGTSEYGKTVACMAAQSIFGNPSQNDNNGIGINFNFTNAGLEYRLNLYNNMPLFINEMQLQKEAKDYDKMLFMIESGRGKARATKSGGIGNETSWDNIVITNGEKNIVKNNSDNGAYNRCLSCELTTYSYENLSEVADFAKENYGTVIREILKHLPEYDLKEIFKSMRELTKTEGDEITEKQKILQAVIMTGDKILTDIIFQDGFYLTLDNFQKKSVKKEDISIEKRAYEIVKEWYVSKKRSFIKADDTSEDIEEKNTDIYGKEMGKMYRGYVAIIASQLRKLFDDNGFDFEQIIKAWSRQGYTLCDKSKNQKNVKINGEAIKCVVLNMRIDDECEEPDEIDEERDINLLPF